MQSIVSLILAVLGMYVLLSETRPRSLAHGTSGITEMQDVKDEQEKILRRFDEKSNKKTTYTKEEIDQKKVDVNSDLEILFESMSDNDHSAIGIHPDKKGSIKAMKLEEQHGSKHNPAMKNRRKINLETKRNFVPQIETIEFDRYWPNATVPYYINLDLFENKTKVTTLIKEAKEDFEAKTCVKLISKSIEEIQAEELKFYVNVTNDPGGCFSHVGIYREAMNIGQTLSLKENGCMYRSTVIHEFCHALGMEHEQSRQDRDKHIKVNFENVEEDKKFSLQKEETLDNNPYDYSSVMQYELKAFSTKNWENTMNFRDPELEFLAGLLTELSFYDVMDITAVVVWIDIKHNCLTNIQCKNKAFLDHQCKCYCPEGLKGDDCDTIASDDCGGIIDLVPGQEIEITSPNYPNDYNVGKKCYWLLRAQNKSQRVMIKILDFDLPSNEELLRCYHWLEVRYNLIGQPGKKFCDDRLSRNKISSTEFGNPELMMLIFDTATVTGVQATRGFKIIAEAFEVKPDGCASEPPIVANATNNFKDEGMQIGAIIKYKCDYYFQMVGRDTITCNADGTWSDIRFQCNMMNPVFICDFEDGECGLSLTTDDDAYKLYVDTESWTETTEDGIIQDRDNSYLKFDPMETDKKIWVYFSIPTLLEVDKTYCLSFYFKRSSASGKCAALYVGDAYHYRWFYKECKKGDWVLFQGNYGPWRDLSVSRTEIRFYAEIESENGGELDIYFDNIIISEGQC